MQIVFNHYVQPMGSFHTDEALKGTNFIWASVLEATEMPLCLPHLLTYRPPQHTHTLSETSLLWRVGTKPPRMLSAPPPRSPPLTSFMSVLKR